MRKMLLLPLLCISINIYSQDYDFVSPPLLDSSSIKEAQFNGDWNNYVQGIFNKSIKQLLKDGKEGTCEVFFTVDENGKVNNIKALTMQGTVIARVCVRAISRSGKWIPAKNSSGKSIKSNKIENFTFLLPEE
jgi:hypothetical protein